MASGIYSITCTVTMKQYIGSAVDIDARWRVHRHVLRKNKHHSAKLQNTFNKYGESVLEFAVLETVTDKATLIEREQAFIDKLKPWMNIHQFASSALGTKRTEKARKRMSEAQKEASKTRESPMKGKKHSEETIEKIKLARSKQVMKTGYKFTDEHKAKLSSAKIGKPSPNKGKPVSEETRAKMAAAHVGKKMPPRSEEYRKKISEHKTAYWANRRQES